MNGLKSLRALWSNLSAGMQRFPIPLLLAAAVSILAILIPSLEDTLSSSATDAWIRVALVLALGIPLSLCLKMFYERKPKLGASAKLIFYLCAAVLLALCYFFLLPQFNLVYLTRYAVYSLALYVLFTVIPYYPRRENFERYVIGLLIRFLITAVYSAVLFGGIAIILFTCDKLIGLTVSGKAYLNVWITIVGIFAPSFFLSGVPIRPGDKSDDPAGYPPILKALLLYIVMPLIAVYTVILYIYFVQIIVTSVWPSGLVSHLVIWFAMVSIGVLLFIEPLRSQDKWVRFFHFWFPKLILPLLFMMFISIGIRIRTYGVTENRYYVVVAGLWVLGVMIYLNLARIKRFPILLLSLAVVASLSVTGPWSSFSVSERSQNQRLYAILDKYDRIENDAVVNKPGQVIAQPDRQEINQIVYYFEKTERLQKLSYVPEGFRTADMQQVFGFEYEPYDYYSPGGPSFYLSTAIEQPIDIRNYEYLIRLQGAKQKIELADKSLKLEYDAGASRDGSGQLRISLEGKAIYAGSLNRLIEPLVDRHQDQDHSGELTLEEAAVLDENAALRLKVVILSLQGQHHAEGAGFRLEGADLYVLIQLK